MPDGDVDYFGPAGSTSSPSRDRPVLRIGRNGPIPKDDGCAGESSPPMRVPRFGVARVGLVGLTATASSCAADPGVHTERGDAAGRGDRRLHRPPRPPAASTLEWSTCPAPRHRIVDALGVHDRRRRWTTPTRRRRRSASPSPAPCSSRRRPPAARAEPRRPGRVGHRAGLVPRRRAAGRAARRATTRSAGIPVASGGRCRPSTAADRRRSTSPSAEDVHRRHRRAARPGRRGRRRRSTSSRSASRSASTASTTSATATARRSARCTRWPTPTASGASCSTAPIDPTAGDPAGPLSADGVPDYAADELDDVDRPLPRAVRRQRAVRGRPGQRGARRRPRGTIRDLPTADFAGGPSQLNRIDLDGPDGRRSPTTRGRGASSATPCATAPTATRRRSPRCRATCSTATRPTTSTRTR